MSAIVEKSKLVNRRTFSKGSTVGERENKKKIGGGGKDARMRITFCFVGKQGRGGGLCPA